ncbi:chorismate-binding protein [Cellulomonas sp. URHD0024]|uniref:chorismate-binding protein n=1 Tax=Cellulomonas sp. URHD0024 TaxID=1302620 RepID=UPI000408EB9F|nr:chorismate-binding protein [Cellulomonas sp. URHD0024]
MPEQTARASASAWFAGVEATDLIEVVDVRAEPHRMTEPGWWAVVGDFEGRVRAWRFATVTPAKVGGARSWKGPDVGAWTSSLDRDEYANAVEVVRGRIQEGDVYQANICRVLSARLPDEPDARALAAVLDAGNPAPFAGGVHVPTGGAHDAVWVVTASPELFLRVADGVVTSGPIKGTAATADALTAKDRAENVMITDLVRNDLQRVCAPGTVEVTSLLGEEHHPGLVHLVSTVQGVLDRSVVDAPDLWARLLEATYPPGSVSGAPKASALRIIESLEREARGPYCGAVGWIEVGDDGSVRAELAVGIRTFWWSDGFLRFGTGAGITWGSDREAEWTETELKAARLVGLASDVDVGPVPE